MRKTLTYGKIAGIPLKLHLNWFVTAVLVTWTLVAIYFPFRYPEWESWQHWMVGVVTSLCFFGSVLLHELGHSLVAEREGVPVRSITLFLFGGVAHITKEPPTPGAEFRIVAAGPLTSLFLAGFFAALGYTGVLGPQASSAALYLGQMNVILAVFNLLPAFPLDGGRILRSVLWKWRNSFREATRWATNSGIAVAVLLVAAGLGLAFWGDFFSGGWVAFMGWYLGTAARESYRQVEKHEQMDLLNYHQMRTVRMIELDKSIFLPASPYRSLFSLQNPARPALQPITVKEPAVRNLEE
jgi:Zn-dependent protease